MSTIEDKLVSINSQGVSTPNDGYIVYDRGITTEIWNITKHIHDVKYAPPCCISLFGCCPLITCGQGDGKREYFRVLENGFEKNEPSCIVPLTWIITCNPAHTCTIQERSLYGIFDCNSCMFDNINRTYFDRGLYDDRDFYSSIGYKKGIPRFFANEVKYVICCQDAPGWFNELIACYSPLLCGDRVRYLPYEYYCWCCSTRASCFTNFCGLFGPKTDEPAACITKLIDSLDIGQGPLLVDALHSSRAAWSKRIGKE